MAETVACPYCSSLVVPSRTPEGGLLCPVCGNTGRRSDAAWPAPHPGTLPYAPGAVASLVLGIVTFLPYVGLVTGWLAIHYGNAARRAIQAQPGRYQGQGLATAGRLLGIIGMCLFVVTILLAAVVFVLVSNLAHRGPNGTVSP